MNDSVIIARRFNGPPNSANGGYTCGLVGTAIEAPSVRVSLRKPPPLEVPLLRRREDDGSVSLLRGDDAIATGVPADVQAHPPPAPTVEEAEIATRNYVGFAHHRFPTCFVCGTAREDGLRIDAVTGEVVETIPLGAGATDVAVGASAVWVSDEAGDRVFRVDPQSDQVTASINVGTGPTALAVGFGSVWVANSLDGTVSRIDPQTNTVSATVAVGDGTGGVAASNAGIWVASQYAGKVALINPATNAVRRTITVGNRPQDMALAGGLLWVATRPAAASHRGGTLRVLSTGIADTFDPVLTQNLGSVLPLTYDGLTAFQRVGGSGSLQLVPDLAVSLPSPMDGGTTYTFQLRRGIRYSNGELVRPEDFRRALERDLILGGNGNYGGPFADVVGGAACAAHPSHCDLSQGVVTDDTADTITFHLVAPNPEFPERLTLPDAYAVPAGTPNHDIGLHPLPATGPYQWVDVSRYAVSLVRNPYFREWSHAARPDGYPDRIVWHHVSSSEAGLTAVERGNADYYYDGVPQDRLDEVQTRFASQLHLTPTSSTLALILNTRTPPFTDVRVRRAISYAVDRARIAQLLGQGTEPACQILPVGLPGYRRYCPYTTDPNPAGIWHAPNLAAAQRLIAASGTSGTRVTIWNLAADVNGTLDPYLASLLDRLGYPTQVKDFPSSDPNAPVRFADSRTTAQAALYWIPIGALYPSASQILQTNFACQSFAPSSPGNSNWSEFCDHRLGAQINSALAAESNNSPATASLWAQAEPHRHRPSPSRSPDHNERHPPRLRTRRQLPVQLPTRRAARPALGQLAAHWFAGHIATRDSHSARFDTSETPPETADIVALEDPASADRSTRFRDAP